MSSEISECRLCSVKGRKALFHRWTTYSITDAAIVEYEDGTVNIAQPTDIKFLTTEWTNKPTVCGRRAHWIVGYQGKTKKILICTRCGKSTAFDLDNKNKNEFQYCPICGAKMDKKL